MNENNNISLNNLANDPEYNFINTLQNENNIYGFDQNDNLESPYIDLDLTCNYFDEDSFTERYSKFNNFSVMSLNIQSLPAKFQLLSEMINNFQINSYQPSVICLQEVWKLPNDSLFNMAGYHEPIFKSRSNNLQGGGVAVYVDNSYNFKLLPDISIFYDRILESQFIELSLTPQKKIIVGSLYRPATNHPTLTSTEQYYQFFELFTNLLNKLSDLNVPVLITGDLNLDLLKYTQIRQVTEFVDLLFSYGFIQLILKPTRVTNNSATLIDHFITSSTAEFSESAILLTDVSDHFPIFYFTKDKKPIAKGSIKTRNFSATMINRFSEQFQNLNWEFLYTIQDTQEAYDSFSETFFDLFNLYFPLTDKKQNKNTDCLLPWFTKGLFISRKTKILLFKNSKKDPSVTNMTNYKNFRNLYSKVLRASKKLHYEKELIKYQSDSRKTWQVLRKAINKNKFSNKGILSITVNGKSITDPKQMADEFNKFFLGVAPSISSKITPTDNHPPSEIINEDLSFNINAIPVTSNEIFEIIKSIQNKKSQDLYGLSNTFVKKIINLIADPLTYIFNLSFKNGLVPHQLKIAKIVPLYKSGDNSLTDNYRPIALLPIFSKLLEKLAFNRLSTYIEGNNLLSMYQYGFRKNHSTDNPMLKLVNYITNAWERKEHVIGIFCDLKKAFDTVDHAILLEKLYKFGIKGTSYEWFKSYLLNRQQLICISDILSNIELISTGVPQGSILGPLLFLIYINGLPLSSKFLTLLFADDTTLLYSHADPIELIQIVNLELWKVNNYFRFHKMALHTSKTKFILFTQNAQVKNMDLKVYINNSNDPTAYLDFPNNTSISRLQRVYSEDNVPAIRFLGVFFDPSLNFNYHTQLLCSKLSKSLYILRASKNLLTKKTQKLIYYSLFHSHLIYCITIWTCTSKSNLQKVAVLQKSAVRIIDDAHYNSHTEPIFKKHEILPFDKLVLFFNLQFAHRYLLNLLPLSLKEIWQINQNQINLGNQNDQIRLRPRGTFRLVFTRLSICEKFPYFSVPRYWNNFPDLEIKNSTTKTEFNNKLKKYLIGELSSNVNCNRLLCPTCHLQIEN